ncbi:mPR-like GPCR protein [Dichotomopilus funicola]|uniref:MPR-like GPCR protein n=1 Tax=Dichotomopilus funicola TaxID=1934379 RepID=A0AAN6UZU4_9PEZI|nr:mPR-like GPCR protein [Dichotomopilus funicola]
MSSRNRPSAPIQRQTETTPPLLNAPITSTTSHVAERLFTSKEVPPWYSEPFIYTGYRPINYSVDFCLRSLAYLHNETVNIFSHLIPGFIALILISIIPRYFDEHFPDASWKDIVVVQIYLATSAICFTISALYHTLLCHSEWYHGLWVRFDYTAILFQMLGSFVSGIYIGFYCEPNLQKLYWSMIGGLSLLSAVIVLNPKYQSRKWRPLRVSSFVATGFSAFAPIIHAALIFPYHQLDQQAGLRYYYVEGALVLIGTVHYMSHFPESWKPGKFDIWGASHQIFHIFVVLSAVVHFYGILSAFRWNYENPRCPVGSQGVSFG